VNYQPNRFGEYAEDPRAAEPPQIVGAIADRYDHRSDDDYYSQPRALYQLMSEDQRRQLFGNIARHIRGVPEDILRKALDHFAKIDPGYSTGVALALESI